VSPLKESGGFQHDWPATLGIGRTSPRSFRLAEIECDKERVCIPEVLEADPEAASTGYLLRVAERDFR